MNTTIIVEIIKILPSLLGFCFLLCCLFLFYRPIRDELIPKLGSFKALGVELSFVKEYIEKSIRLAEKSPQWKVRTSSVDQKRVLTRIKSHLGYFKNSRILWVDDHPENNKNEIRMFSELGGEIDLAKDLNEASTLMKNHSYDLVFSDMVHGDNKTAGLELLDSLVSKREFLPVIFYVGVFDPALGTPARAFGITNRPDELVHLALDALERKKD